MTTLEKTLAFSLIAGATALPAVGQTPPAQKMLKVGVVDMQRVSQESLLGKGYATKIDGLESEIRSELTKRQNEAAKMDAAIKALEDELQKQASILSEDAQNKKRQDIVKKGRERQAYAEDSQAEIQGMQERARQRAADFQAEFNQRVQPLLQAVAKEKGLDFVLDRSTIVLINNELDITRDIIVKADDAEKAGRPAAPSAPAAPAAAPKPTPSPESRK